MSENEILIAADHAGFELKEYLKDYLIDKSYNISDLGTYSEESTDYPDLIHPLASDISVGNHEFGIIICGSANGVSMTANKYKNVRAAISWNKEVAELARLHNNANILALPARFLDYDEAKEIVETFLNTKFEEGRHARRVEKINIKN